MKAIQLLDNSDFPELGEVEVSEPIPGDDAILIEVHAAGVITTELGWYPTHNTRGGQKRLHAIPGHEFSGVIAALGKNVHGFSIGDEVYGMNDWFDEGATAEYCKTIPSSIALKPATLSHTEAASVPISALTAWQGLFDRAKLQTGEQILVHGGAGAVGAYVVQFAKWRGAEVIATASGANVEFARSLGADVVIDYKTVNFERAVQGVDIVFDSVGGDTLTRSFALLKPGGRSITIASGNEGSKDERIKEAFFIVEPNQPQLIEVGALIDKGVIETFVGATVCLEDAPLAYANRIRKLGPGKVVVAVSGTEQRRPAL
jgi:NADPH:quinone reductase-like Zn-dependent oxidoreductase